MADARLTAPAPSTAKINLLVKKATFFPGRTDPAYDTAVTASDIQF
ncbi:MAG TPA: hypothetical protein VK540_24015 [Polyangiaceae bacterium]|nr:hypothetical protein [Polyangiaceae bacterium]